MINTRNDSRKIRSGKDGALFDGTGRLLSTVENFTIQINIVNGQHLPIGAVQAREYLQSISVSLAFTEAVIDDVRLMQVLKDLKDGKQTQLNFQGYLRAEDGQEHRSIMRDCIPTGTIDIQNVQVGDSVKRNWSFTVNDFPDLQKYISV